MEEPCTTGTAQRGFLEAYLKTEIWMMYSYNKARYLDGGAM